MGFSNFGEIGPVEFYELGQSPVKSLLFTVYFFKVDGVLIDTSAIKCRQMLPEFTGNQQPQAIYLTHFHEDHTGNVNYFQKRYGIYAYGHEICAEKMRNSYDLLPYEKILFGKPEAADILTVTEFFDTDNYRFQSIHTPGHSPDHVCYFVASEGWLFSGDMYVADKIKIWRRGEDLIQQIQSLNVLIGLDFDTLFCAHNPQISGGKQKLIQKREHFVEFYEQVKLCIAKGYSPRETMSAMKIREKYHVKWITFNDVSAMQKVLSVYEGILNEQTPRR